MIYVFIFKGIRRFCADWDLNPQLAHCESLAVDITNEPRVLSLKDNLLRSI